MLKWRQISDDFIAVDVGKEYNGKPFYWTTFYYHKGLIVDTGCPHTAEEVVKFIGDMKLDVTAVLLTHYHEDHSGGASLFKEKFHVNVFAPEKSLEILANPPEIPAYRQVVWGQPKPVEAMPLETEMKVGDLAIKTFGTPGHSFDHVSFLIGRDLFIGDLVANPNPVIIMRDEDSIEVINSLKKIVKLDFERAYGGHGIWEKGEVKSTLNNMLKLKKNVEALWREGLNAEQIVEKIFVNAPKKVLQMEEVSECEWSRKNLVESLLGMRHKPAVKP
ncbi:MAG: MBL fold metallo-hydrolase [Candidatus Bathycorpusculaceae bacterium]